MSQTPQPAPNSYTEKIEATYSAFLIVDWTKLYVIYKVNHEKVFSVKVLLITQAKVILIKGQASIVSKWRRVG